MAWLLRRAKRRNRLLVLGWDCAGPELVFDQFEKDLPVTTHLRQQGTWGLLKSSIPCITVPAWSSMLSSRDPGVLGVYGFRNRVDYSYQQMTRADSTTIREKRVWDYLGENGLTSLVVGVPQTYPVSPIRGSLISDFLTPGTASAFAYPAILKQEILKVVPDYHFDVADFRTPDKAQLLQRLIDLTEVQFRAVKHIMTTRDWDFLMHVNIGVDRLHHGFWRYHDPTHRLHEAGSRFGSAIRDYYRMIDQMAGELIAEAGDQTAVMLVSDHGVKRMDGAVALNEWLWRQGWLCLRQAPPDGSVARFEALDIDWSRTRAWGSGGYYGRIFLNVQGREPDGVISPAAYEEIRSELGDALMGVTGPDGVSLDTQVFKPQMIYQQVNGYAPDLLVYFGDLHWRAVGGIGYGQHYTLENDTGPDDANHAQDGLFVFYQPRRSGMGQVAGHQLMDVAPTILTYFGLRVPAVMQGRIIQ
jgi:predicted AlkP superfamily phosphohydrolase/phosphomutase